MPIRYVFKMWCITISIFITWRNFWFFRCSNNTSDSHKGIRNILAKLYRFCFFSAYQTSLLLSLWVKFMSWFTFKLHYDEGEVARHIAVNCDAHSRPDHPEQAYTTYGPRAACGPRKLFLRPARAFSIIENVAKARPRISNCRSRISSIPQRNLFIEMENTLAARCKFMLISWPFELS